MIRGIFTIAVAFALIGGAAAAQDMAPPAANCTATDQTLPAALSGWNAKSDLLAATSAADVNKAALIPGHAVTLTLHPTRDMAYIMQPEKPGGSVAHGGMVALTISEAGLYQISLGAGPWVDVLKDKTVIASSAHAPGPKCSTIRKTVAFPLEPGSYVLQISANADPTLAMMVSKLP